MATDVFHMDANGVRISVDRAVFANHTYATRNISGVAAIADRGVRWPGILTMALGFGLLIGGFVFSHTFTMILGVGGVLSGSLNLSRKRPKYGVRIVTQRGPVYVLASQDKQYVETVSTALQKAMSAARRARPSSANPASPSRHSRARGNLAALPRRRRRRSGRPLVRYSRAPSRHSRTGGNLASLPSPPPPAFSETPSALGGGAFRAVYPLPSFPRRREPRSPPIPAVFGNAVGAKRRGASAPPTLRHRRPFSSFPRRREPRPPLPALRMFGPNGPERQNCAVFHS